MKTFADVKRRMVVGATMTMIGHGWQPQGRLINKPRRIITRQSNGIQFEGGSWFYFPKASEVKILDDRTFKVTYNDHDGHVDDWLTYEFNDSAIVAD